MVSIADLVYFMARAMGSEMRNFYIGWSWYIVNYYVPLLIVAQVLVIYYLLKRPPATH